MSVRGVMWLSPSACSGLMYAGVPMETPVAVSRSPGVASSARAIPKSATTASPSESRMFSGLISRWTSPWAWAYSSAPATCVAIRIASSSGSCRSRSSRARRVSPST